MLIKEILKGTTSEITVMEKKDNTLLAGPWVGEFGWELFCWQGYLRKISKNYDKTVIIGKKGHELLYADFMSEYVVYNHKPIKSNMWMGTINTKDIPEIVRKYNPTAHVKEFDIGFSWEKRSTAFDTQEFIKYTSDTLDKKYDVIVHPRNRSIGKKRNWSKKKWQELIDLLKADGFSVALIGTDETFALNNVDDYRNTSINDVVSLYNRCGLVVGPSSGPMHLASLCGTPHFVWSTEHNRIRYTDYWNPLKTKVYFYSGEDWNPEVINIYNRIKKYLNEEK